MKSIDTQPATAIVSTPATQAGSHCEASVVHKNGTVRRSRFVLHPSQQRVARTIDELNRAKSAAPVAQPADGDSLPTITRYMVLKALLGHPQGIAALDLAMELVRRKDAGVIKRVAAVLAREVKRGLVEPTQGERTGAKRVLTAAGRIVAAQIVINETRAQEQRRTLTAAIGRTAKLGKRVNGVFDYARKVQFGLC